MPITKIATCCYCGMRTTLVLSKARHELACASCGAPLHELKRLKKPVETPRSQPRPEPKPSKSWSKESYRRKKSRKRERPRKSFKRRFLEEAWDVLEDIFD